MKKPAKRLHKVKLVKDSRRTLSSIRRTIRKQSYRKDLKMVRVTLAIDGRDRTMMFLSRLQFVVHQPYFVANVQL